MKKLISTLKKWNDAYPEHVGLLYIKFYDDESGSIKTMDDDEIFYFHDFKVLFSTDPVEYKKSNNG